MDRPDDLNIPYESQDETQLQDVFLVSGGVVVMAATVTDKPALVIRFAFASGDGFATPVLLALDDDAMRGLPQLFEKAVTDALAAAEEKRRG